MLDLLDARWPWVKTQDRIQQPCPCLGYCSRASGEGFLSQWLGEGYSDIKPTAWKSPQPSQPAEPLRKDPRPKEWDQLARSDFHYKTTQRRREEEKKSPTATEKGRTDRYRMVPEVAVSTLHVGGSDVWVASLLT